MEEESAIPRLSHGGPYLGDVKELIYDVMRMAVYAAETGNLQAHIKLSELYRIWNRKIVDGDDIDSDDITLLQLYYHDLTLQLKPVTAISLRATESTFGKDYMLTEAGKHARNMWITAFGVLALIMGISLFQYTFEFYSAQWAQDMGSNFALMSIFYWVALSIAPFAYGAFGASVRLLRITEQKLRLRSFDPRRLPEHRNRLVLGTLSGGVLVMLYSSGGVTDTGVKLTEVTIGFIAGYSIDVLFSILDGLVVRLSFKPVIRQTTTITNTSSPASPPARESEDQKILNKILGNKPMKSNSRVEME
ncbi:MAG: hypothetical protein OEZ43_12730 [Gammaproteobacteria bacterium]|nr:hypothetical protein [Gammaproteobacteria bacterium]